MPSDPRTTLVSKRSYNEIVRGLDRYRKHNEEDIQDSPSAIRIDYRSSLVAMIESILHKNKDPFWRCRPTQKGTADHMLEYLKDKGLLVPYLNGYTFPGTNTPSKEEIEAKALIALADLHSQE